MWVPCAQGSQVGRAPSWNSRVGLQSRRAGSSPCSVEFPCMKRRCQLTPSTARVSPVLSLLLGRFIFFNLLHCLVNHCSSARRIGVSRAGLAVPPPAGSAPSIIMTQHLAAPWAFQRRFIKKHTVHASTINPGRSCRACRASHTSLRAGAGPTTPGLNCRGRFELLGVPFS